MKYLFILNDPPYGTERSYNGLRLARELLKDPAKGNEVRVFLLGDAAACAKGNQCAACPEISRSTRPAWAPGPPCQIARTIGSP